MLRLRLTPIYDNAHPWTEFKDKLKALLGEDHRASLNKIMSRDLTNASALIRHAELERMFEDITDLHSVLVKWALLLIDMDGKALHHKYAQVVSLISGRYSLLRCLAVDFQG